MAPTTNSRRRNQRINNNTNGGILGLIDGNRRPNVRNNKHRAQSASKFENHHGSSSSSSSSSSNNNDDDDLSLVDTPPPKTVVFSTLAGSPMEEDDDDDSMMQQEDQVSDISGLSPATSSSDTSEKEQESPPFNYSLQGKALLFRKRGEDAYGADDESSESDASSTLHSSSRHPPSPDTFGSTSSMEDISISNDDDDEEEEVSFASEGESEDSVQGLIDNNDEDESDDEYVMEEDSASDTDDENLDSDIELEVDTKPKRDRARKGPVNKKRVEEKAAVDKDGKQATSETTAPSQKASPTQSNDDKLVEDDTDDNEVISSGIDVEDSSQYGGSQKQDPSKVAIETQLEQWNDTDTEDEAVEDNVSSVSLPHEKKQPNRQRSFQKIKLPAMKESVQKKNETAKPSPLAAEPKGESIYRMNRDKQLSDQDEMVVVAQVLEGTFLDDDDDDDEIVVIAEVISEEDSGQQEDVDDQQDVESEVNDAPRDPNDTQNTSITSLDEDEKSTERHHSDVYEHEDDGAVSFVDEDEDDCKAQPFCDAHDEPSASLKSSLEFRSNEDVVHEDSVAVSTSCEVAIEDADAKLEILNDTTLPDAPESSRSPISNGTLNDDDKGEFVHSPVMDEGATLALTSPPTKADKVAPSEYDGKAVDVAKDITTGSPTEPITPKPGTTDSDSLKTSSSPSNKLVGTNAASLDSSIVASMPKSAGMTEERNKEPSRRPRLRRFRSEGSIKPGKWGTGSKIGVGSFGVVRVGMNKKTGTLMAVKSITVSKAVMKDVQTEIDLLKSLDHIHIVRYLGAETDGTHLHIFQEWVPGGSVTSLLHKFGPFSMQVVRAYLFQILSGLTYLHENRILHRDIKGGNVLVSDSGVVKLADFGSSKRLAQQQADAMENLTMRGTPYFMAPEVFEEKYGSKADIWSVGCVAFQMATGSPPWKGMGFSNPMTLFIHIKDTKGLPSYDWPDANNEKTTRFKSMLEKCFYRDPSKRPTAKALSSDPFFTDSVQSTSEDQSRGLFSPGGESVSTWGSTRSPQPTPTRSSPHVAFGKASFLSPPLPTRINQGALRQDVISPLAPSPVVPVDASEWPSWAREKLQDRKSPYKVRPPPENGGDGLPQASPSSRVMLDSLAVSEDSSAVENPFRRRRNRKSGDTSLGTGSMSTLDGLSFLEGKSRGDPETPTGR